MINNGPALINQAIQGKNTDIRISYAAGLQPQTTRAGEVEGTRLFAILNRIDSHLSAAEFTADDIYTRLYGQPISNPTDKADKPVTVNERLNDLEQRMSNLVGRLQDTQNRI